MVRTGLTEVGLGSRCLQGTADICPMALSAWPTTLSWQPMVLRAQGGGVSLSATNRARAEIAGEVRAAHSTTSLIKLVY